PAGVRLRPITGRRCWLRCAPRWKPGPSPPARRRQRRPTGCRLNQAPHGPAGLQEAPVAAPSREETALSGQVQRLREQLKTVTQLQSVVETIRALAEVNARRAQAVASDVAQYARTVHLALHVVLRSL